MYRGGEGCSCLLQQVLIEPLCEPLKNTKHWEKSVTYSTALVYTVVSEMEPRLGWNRSVPNKTLRYQEWLQGLELSVSCTTKVNIYITVKMEMLCSGDSEILYEIVRDTTRKSEKHHARFRVVSLNPRYNVKFYYGSI